MAGPGVLRMLMLRYLLYDALLRPGPWTQALLNDRSRADSWVQVICNILAQAIPCISLLATDEEGTSQQPPVVISDEGSGGAEAGVVLFLSSGGSELPLVPLGLGKAFSQLKLRCPAERPPHVVVLEPVKPVAAACLECIAENNIDDFVSVASDIIPGQRVSLAVATAAEDISTLPAALDTISETLSELYGQSQDAAPVPVVPSHVAIHVALVSIPLGQAVPIRTQVNDVSGFDLRGFNRFRQSHLTDTVRLRDIKRELLSDPHELQMLETQATLGTADLEKEAVISVDVTSDGVCNAVAAWVVTEVRHKGHDPWRLPSNGPECRGRRQIVCHLGQPLDLKAGTSCRVSGRYNSGTSSFEFNCQVESEFPKSSEIQIAETGKEGVVVERWHFGMINDHRRNNVYDLAIQQAVRHLSGTAASVSVLDIGAGSGLLSMMAARAGATAVTAIERVNALAKSAAEIVTENGYAAQVAIVHGESTDFEPEDLEGGQRADLLVSEILDDGLLGEGVLSTVSHARQELLKPGAPVIPAFASIWAVPVECPVQPEPVPVPASAAMHRSGGAAGRISDHSSRNLSLSSYDVFHPTQQSKYHSIRLDRVSHGQLSKPVRVFDFDFQCPLRDPAAKSDYSRDHELHLAATRSGSINAVAFWFTAKLWHWPDVDGCASDRSKESGWYDLCSYPAEAERCGAKDSSRCWTQAIHFLPQPVPVVEGQNLVMKAHHGPSRVSFRISTCGVGD